MRHLLFLAAFLITATGSVMSGEAAQAASTPRLVETVAAGSTLAGLGRSDAGQQAVIDAISAQVTATGRAAVVVKMAVPFAPETLLTPSQAAEQRLEIARAATALRGKVPAAATFSAFADMPYVRLDVGPAGLTQLLSATGLVRIAEAKSFNWMRDFVQLRTAVATERHRSTPAAGDAPGTTARIVGGTVAAAGVHPFQVGLLKKTIANNFDAQFCGGTLVADRYVVTAAHCSDSIVNASTEVQVLVKTQKLDGSGQRINVSQVYLHPNWNASTFNYDAAVWVLATPVTGPYASLTTVQPTVAGTQLRVSGWGSLSYQGSYPIDLRVVDVPFVPTVSGACQYQTGITGQMICAGQAGKDSCQGDSGGPLTRNPGSGYTVLTGIVSFGNGCAYANYPGVYTNVASTSIKSFLQSKIVVALSYVKAGTGTGTVSFTSNGASSSCTASCVKRYNMGRTVTLKAVAPVGSVFAGWTGGGCSGTGSCTTTMSAAKTVKATFNAVPTFAITYTKAGTAAGVVTFTPAGTLSKCASSCTARFNAGKVVTLTAIPAAGKIFSGWTGVGCSGIGTCRLAMTTNRAIKATFR